MNFDDTITEFTQRPLGGNPSAWMLTFADLLSLILTFFVMLYSMSELDVKKWQGITSSFTARLNPESDVSVGEYYGNLTVGKLDSARSFNLGYLESIITDKIRREPALGDVVIQRVDDKLVLSLYSDLLFEPGQAKLKENAIRPLAMLGAILGQVGNAIEVTGHTDPGAISSGDFPSNWELSLSRAITVVNHLKTGGYSYAMQAYGVADSRFSQLPQNLDEKERYRLARRVDIEVKEYRAMQ